MNATKAHATIVFVETKVSEMYAYYGVIKFEINISVMKALYQISALA